MRFDMIAVKDIETFGLRCQAPGHLFGDESTQFIHLSLEIGKVNHGNRPSFPT